MLKLSEYLQRIYNEKMEGSYAFGSTHHEIITGKGAAGVANTYQLELVGKEIVGFINGKEIKLTIDEFAKQYPEIAKEVLQVLKEKGSISFTPDKKPPYDFVKAPTTKNELKVTPDIPNVEE